MIRSCVRFPLLTLSTMIIIASAAPTRAQERASAPDYFSDLQACRAIAAAAERVACYDSVTDKIVAARNAGDIRIIDREDVRKTRRQLFGITMPEVAMLKDEDAAVEGRAELFETTVASGRQTGASSWRFTTAEGAVWEINNPPRKLAPIMPGDKVVFKKASLGYYFIRINGQIGVKGKRVV